MTMTAAVPDIVVVELADFSPYFHYKQCHHSSTLLPLIKGLKKF